ncbi:hypothetical protein C0992_012712 [Termitomyces sp. T32_za158]|nr:hypothetical protein C0992_012712 [Termitomyces sp. T32_za158]
MSVTLNPSNSLGFKRPLTQLVKRTLTITNHNSLPIAFKVKTTAPKLYCVRPNSGRVEPGESLDVSVMLQPLKEEPPLNLKCKDKFLIQSTLITPAKAMMNSADIWSISDSSEEGKVVQHKLRVAFLPAEGQALEEEDEPQAHSFDGARKHLVNGHANRIPDSMELPPQPQEVHRAPTPPVDFSVAREDSRELAHDVPLVHVSSAIDHRPEHTVLPTEQDSDLEYAPDPAPIPIPAPVPVQESAVSPESISIPIPIQEPVPVRVPAPEPASLQDSYNEELAAKYELALHEIERLRTVVAKYEESAVSEIRRRRPVLSDDGMSVAETDVQTAFADEGQYPQQEGVPLQVVVIVALGVFITTYLFF